MENVQDKKIMSTVILTRKIKSLVTSLRQQNKTNSFYRIFYKADRYSTSKRDTDYLSPHSF